ncbi:MULTISPECIES: tryptophan--tRNA ligase [unclassified Meiothermus]|uniref:tryptophan--tRNA ligase n=1 Tax=unclassified Meiothermus TaxID=370471 RepID=UPI000D7BE725|nr:MULTISPECIES: tryptophan--tRNA ligase [unclassified Meiothermus]PZA06562.1 tryptophan--tRNA ligase [Meiothermus sp. Pnk-1]RYM36249.1 tryptophan--tRNA ligase [Meiothermus sp. PNK-Is4]
MKRVLSGIQPTGEIHIGNWLGAIVNYVDLGKKLGREALYCIVDYHAMTNPLAYEKELLAQRTFEAALVNIAAGLDPEHVTLFVQSHVPEHTELSWVFTNLTPVGDLQRMTQYKDKAAKLESVGAGLLMYPVLQAADIMIYKADTVPVGEDQLQHLELAREIARRFNALFGETFPEPNAYLNPHAPRVPGIDGKAKMSKSAGNTIGLLEDPKSVWEKIRLLPDDPARLRLADPGDPERSVVFKFLPYFAPKEMVEVLKEEHRRAGIGTLAIKQILFEQYMKATQPIRAKAEWLRQNPDYVLDSLEDGARRARQIAQATMEEVREKIGLLRFPSKQQVNRV